MSYLKVTLIDVGWGDSILIEASDRNNCPRFALIDSNDNADREYWPSWNFLRKHFGVREDEFTVIEPWFDFVMLSHDHSDHGTGLKRIIQEYGTRNFWYPKVDMTRSVLLSALLSYANRSTNVVNHQHLDNNRQLGNLGEVAMQVMWPNPNQIEDNPNNNSIVLALELHNTTFLLTGDAEGSVWRAIAGNIPANTRIVKVPHHGSKNGTLYRRNAPWVDALDNMQADPHLGISCHPTVPNRYDFPHWEVIARFNQSNYPYYRTDLHYHITFSIDDTGIVQVKYSH